ncbi:MAG: hypothetical protein JW822_03395 [Spirochaetales bacterium]|nr:hypothetical protein [Spirochaetales bacterium]
MSGKNTRSNKVIIVYFNLLAFFICGLIYTFIPLAVPEEKDGVFNETRMLITYTFGTRLFNEVAKGNQNIKHLYTEANAYIKLIGHTPDKLLSLEACMDSEFIVYGHVIGTTAAGEDAAYGAIPVFYVEKWRPTQYLTNVFYNHKQSGFFKMFLLYALFFVLGNMIFGFLILIQVIADKKPRATLY